MTDFRTINRGTFLHQRISTALTLLGLVCAATPAAAQLQGPSSSQTAYVAPTAPGWTSIALLTVGDQDQKHGYPMVGIPDGLGAVAGRFEHGRYTSDRDYMTVFMNHELTAGTGVPRLHGSAGAFVSQWTLHLNSLEVKEGEDLIRDVFTWNGAANQYVYANGTPAGQFSRFCAADLPLPTAFYNPRTGKGFRGRIYMNGEESDEGRAFAHVVSGQQKGDSYELPHLGRFSWENSVAHPNAGDKTVVVGLDDSTPGQIYLYVGSKRYWGNPVEQAGLHGGRLFGVTVTDGGSNYGGGPAPLENAGAINGTFTLMNVSDVAVGPEAVLEAASDARGVTKFARPEDGAWDTRDPKVFYFVTTGASGQTARLYKLTLNSLSNPSGGVIELVVDSASLVGTDSAAARSFDNITVDGRGLVLVQEDPGNSDYIAKTWQVNPADALNAVQIFESDRDRFLPPTPAPFNRDEESSGVIEVTDIVKSARWYQRGRRYFLGDMQAHYSIPGELVQGGQLYLLISPRERVSGWPVREDDDHGDEDHRDDHHRGDDHRD